MKKVLIIRGSALGDVVKFLPVASALKNNFDEEFEIHWLVTKKFKTVLEGNRFIDKILVFEDYKDLWFRIAKRIFRRKDSLVGLNKWLKFSKANKLQKENYDIVINLHEKFDAAMFAEACSAPKLAKAPWLPGSDVVSKEDKNVILKGLETLKSLDKKFDVDDFVNKNIDYGWNFGAEELERTESLLKNNGLDSDRFIIFVLSTTWESKNYPVKNWIKLTQLAVENNKAVVFMGDAKDKEALKKIKASVNGSQLVDLIGKTSLRQMIMVLNKADVVVGGDTGPLHIAASLNVPTITLMNSTSPEVHGTLGKKGIMLTADYPCKNCYKVVCPKGECCMQYIAPEKVFETILRCAELESVSNN
ncbi:MAG: glycosyltransferase family 9 protein [Phascolarctobacterium sp.]|nr:glycosyltransferase family 9 protein [Phascolarctobacterium sp.]